jgi:hypothetical protein
MWPYGDVGTGGPVTIAGTENNIAHLSDVVYCKVPARTILRIACKDNSAIYVHNREVSTSLPSTFERGVGG